MTEFPQPYAKVIADSLSLDGHRLTTMEVMMHRYVLSEMNTHRAFSRNSASSRAIPFRKQVALVEKEPAVPIEFPAERPGMQGGDSFEGEQYDKALYGWLRARDSAVEHARYLAELGVHKSVVNRILEPFMMHRVIITATDWDGFWSQRCSPLAQPEIRVAAECMREAYNESQPTYVLYGDWHLPYIQDKDWESILAMLKDWDSTLEMLDEDEWPSVTEYNGSAVEIAKRVSTARSARVSYLNHDGVRDIEKDLGLYNRLVSARPLHASPLEHVCTPAKGETPGNLRGWQQFRHHVEGKVNG